MKTLSYIFSAIILLIFTSCREPERQETHTPSSEVGYEEGNFARFTPRQFEALGMEVGPVATRNLSSPIRVNGMLEVPPQHEATITTVIGGNISAIQVIEGDPVRKGQVLAYLTHPELISMQSDYLETLHRFEMAELEMNRQSRLYEEEVGAGKTFQQTQAEFRSLQGRKKSHESKLRLLNINPEKIQEGEFYERVAIYSPISGSVVNVSVKNGQYVQPETELFELINTEHIHIKLLVYERDVHQVKTGQEIRFRLNTGEGEGMTGRIFSVSQKFEQESKAVQVHAEIDDTETTLIPGMYVKADIFTESLEGPALPESAVFREGISHFAFELVQSRDEGEARIFIPREVKVNARQNGWVGITFLDEVPESALFARNNAYYIHAEMKKGEVDGEH